VNLVLIYNQIFFLNKILYFLLRGILFAKYSDSHGGLVFGFWWHRCGILPAPSVLLVLLSYPLCQSPPPGSSFITLTWETQRDFFHPCALILSLPESPRCPFYTLFRRCRPSLQRPFLSPHVLPFLRWRSRDTLLPSIFHRFFFLTHWVV